MIQKLMNILMLSCKKASELIDMKSVTKLSMKEKVMLRMHTSMCDGCTAYLKQSKILDNLLHKHIRSIEINIPVIENKALQQLIISKL